MPKMKTKSGAKKRFKVTGSGKVLAAYGGTYQDARVEALIAKTVERLVAASERPDLHYSVTLLNSASPETTVTTGVMLVIATPEASVTRKRMASLTAAEGLAPF